MGSRVTLVFEKSCNRSRRTTSTTLCRYGKPHGYVTHPEPSEVADIIASTITGVVEPYVRRQHDEINQRR
jgi:hypothetical protein